MVIYNIQTNGPCSQLVIELVNDAVFVDPNAIAYVTGRIEIDANNGGMVGKFKSRVFGKKYFKPTLKGTGKIYIKASLGSYYKFSLKEDQEIIINADAFIACRNTLELSPRLKISLLNFLSGAPLVTAHVKGNGTIMLLMPGPVVECNLNNEKFVAFNEDIAGYSKEINLSREFAAKGWLPIAQKMVPVFRGTGTIYFTPNPNKGARRLSK